MTRFCFPDPRPPHGGRRPLLQGRRLLPLQRFHGGTAVRRMRAGREKGAHGDLAYVFLRISMSDFEVSYIGERLRQPRSSGGPPQTGVRLLRPGIDEGGAGHAAQGKRRYV